MKNQIEARLEELNQEYLKGQERLNSLDQETASIQKSMLRISGAIQVLQELLQEADQSQKQEAAPDNSTMLSE